jgi:ribonuclease BN (tRNA processing enzyme)
VKLTIFGGDGGFPSPGGATSGYLLEHQGFHLLLDPGYATLPRLTQQLPAERVDAVLVSHGHPDHCADLNPLLRARALQDDPAPALPIYAPRGALDAVLRLDGPAMLAKATDLREFAAGEELAVGPFRVRTWSLPHFLPNVGFRVAAADLVLAYTGDTGPSPNLDPLAEGVDLLLAEATYVDAVPSSDAPYLSSARQAGELAHRARVRRLLLTHVWPGTDPDALEHAARRSFSGPVSAVERGMAVELSRNVPGHQSF